MLFIFQPGLGALAQGAKNTRLRPAPAPALIVIVLKIDIQQYKQLFYWSDPLKT